MRNAARNAIRNARKAIHELDAYVEKPSDAQDAAEAAEVTDDLDDIDTSDDGLTDEEAILAASLEPGVPYVFVRHGNGWHRVTVH